MKRNYSLKKQNLSGTQNTSKITAMNDLDLKGKHILFAYAVLSGFLISSIYNTPCT